MWLYQSFDVMDSRLRRSSKEHYSFSNFHWVTGIPFENDLHGGAYDDLTLWEQIDDGAPYIYSSKEVVIYCARNVVSVLDSNIRSR